MQPPCITSILPVSPGAKSSPPCADARYGDIAATDAVAAIAQFRQDFSRLYYIIEITPALVHGQWP
jgi:hypothetical protein